MYLLHQRCEKRHLGVIRRGNSEDRFSRIRAEPRDRQDGIDIFQDRFDRTDKFEGLWRRPNTLPRADKKGILKRFPEPFERATDRRLRQIQPVRGAADTSFIKQDIQHDQQVKIDISDICQADISYKK